MTQHLILVAFDGGVALRPLARLVDSYAPGAKEWQGWAHDLDEDRGVLRLTSPRQDASKLPEHLRAAGVVATFTTEVPLARCTMTWAEVEPVGVAAVMSPDPGPPPAPVAAPVASQAPPPTRRKLPPGARPVVEPPPSVIDAGAGTMPAHSSALVVE